MLGTITITQEEYKELTRKSLKYDLLREMAMENKWLTCTERKIYGIEEEKEQ